MAENRDGDQRDTPSGILSPLLLARYKRDLTYRQSREQKRTENATASVLRQAAVYAAMVLSGLLGAVFAWQLLVYTIGAGRVAYFEALGARTQATVLRKQVETARSVLQPERHLVTYGFWAQDVGVIRKENVRQETFDALSVDGEVEVLYVPRNPERAIIRSKLTLRWPIDVLVWGALFATAYMGLKRLRRGALRASTATHDVPPEKDADTPDPTAAQPTLPEKQ